MLLAGNVTPAAPPTVALLKSSSIGPFEQAAVALGEHLKQDPLQPEVLTFDLEGDARNGRSVLAEVHRANPAVLVSVGSLATAVALDDPVPLPVVFSMVLYPRASGFLQRNERHATGASLDVPPAIPFGYLRRLLPAARRVGVLYSVAETGSVIEEARQAAAAVGLDLVAHTVEQPAAAIAALQSLMDDVDAVWTVADSHVFSAATTSGFLLAALRHRTPVFGLSAAHVRAGAIAALVYDNADVGRQAAEIALRHLRGEPLSKIPVTVPRKVSIVLNLRTARNIGVSVAADLRGEAAEVIE